MEYRPLGATGLRISEIGFGCGNTAGLLTGGTFKSQRRAIQHALDLGISYFDTAPNYGERVFTRGRSEENLGRILKAIGARPIIGTKVELHEHELSDIPGAVARSVDQSLERLGIDTADILYLHNRVGVERSGDGGTIGGQIALHDVLGPRGVLEAFERQRQQHSVRFLGFCSSGGDPTANREIIGSGGFQCVQLTYNILVPTEGRRLPPGFSGVDYGQTIDLAAERGLGVVVIRVLAGGVLSGAPQPHELNTGSGVERSYTAGAARVRSLRFLERPSEQSMAQAAIQFALMNAHISTVLVGFSSADQIDEAVRASGRGPLTDSDLGQIEKLYAGELG